MHFPTQRSKLPSSNQGSSALYFCTRASHLTVQGLLSAQAPLSRGKASTGSPLPHLQRATFLQANSSSSIMHHVTSTSLVSLCPLLRSLLQISNVLLLHALSDHHLYNFPLHASKNCITHCIITVWITQTAAALVVSLKSTFKAKARHQDCSLLIAQGFFPL